MKLLKWLLNILFCEENPTMHENRCRIAAQRVRLMNTPMLISDDPLCAQKKAAKLAE